MKSKLNSHLITLLAIAVLANIILYIIAENIIDNYAKNLMSSDIFNRLPEHQMESRKEELDLFSRNMRLMVNFVTLLITGVVLFLFVRKKVEYLHKINETIDDISIGNFDNPVVLEGDDEITYLASRVNEMATKISAYIENEKNMVSGMTHDLKTPLTNVVGYAQMITLNPNIDDNTRQFAEIIFQKSVQMDSILNTISNLNDISEQEVKLSYVTTDKFKSILLPFISELEINEYSVITEFNHSNSVITVSEKETLRVLENIFSNILKYAEEKEVYIYTNTDKEYFNLEVINHTTSDTIDNISKLTNRFYRVDESRTNISSQGLGLNVTKDLMESQHGKLEISQYDNSMMINFKLKFKLKN